MTSLGGTSRRSIHAHCRPTERSWYQLLVLPYSYSLLWALWKVSGVEFNSGTKYTWKSKITNSAETRSPLFRESPIIDEGSWASFMPQFILTWLHGLHQGNTTGRLCLSHLIGPIIGCLSQKKSPLTCKQPSGRNTYHLLVIPWAAVEERYLWSMMWTPQHITHRILRISISMTLVQIW